MTTPGFSAKFGFPRRRQAWRWLIPILLVLLFVPTLIWLPWQAQRMEANERQEQLIADTLWVEQTIRFQLGRDEDSIRVVAAEIANAGLSKNKFRERVAPLLGSSREISRLVWLDANGKSVASTDDTPVALTDFSAPSRLAQAHARATATAQYSQPMQPPAANGPILLDYHLPIMAGDRYIGSLTASYSTASILDEMVPWWFAQDNEIILADGDDNVIDKRVAGGPGRGLYTHRRALDLPGVTLVLRTNSVKSAPKLLPNLLVGSIIMLSIGLLWSLWALWRDINRRLATEGALRQQQEKLQAGARLATMGEIASTLAHELNQPLAAISSYTTGALNLLNSDIARSGALDLDLLKPALEKAGAQAQRAGQIIRSVHTFVKKREPLREAVAIQVLIDSVMPLVELQAHQFFVVIQTSIAPALPPVLADRVLLEQVLLNLTRNAIEAMRNVPPGRRLLRIVAGADETASPPNAVISVIDQGHGIPDDVTDRLFSPFFSTKAEGMGMGLNICRTAIEFHGGTLTHANNPQGGTIFRFSLPSQMAGA